MAIELKLWGESGTVQVSETAFGREFNEALVHQVVTAYLARSRAGTRAQKSRSAVRGGGAKPWRQKGTGRARVGTVRSPLWRSGGLTFAAQPRSYVQKVNRRMYQGAMRSILSELVRQDRLRAIGSETLALNAPKTRLLTAKLKEMGLTGALIVMEDEGIDENLYLATRNLPSVKMVDKQALDPVSLLRFETTLITVAAVQQLEDWLG